MERKLRENDNKGGWAACGTGWLLGRLIEETYELADLAKVDALTLGMLGIVADRVRRFQPAMKPHAAPEKIRDEAADVANFAMMLADVCGGLG
jgi:NTP pyrophosphatase (non-canonical NTP hydrolase)